MEQNSTPLFVLDSFEYKMDYALEASAGTGKTYSITEIVKKLLVEHGLGLDKILIVTYTEKATGELKNRIREMLTSSKDGTPIIEQLKGKVNCDIDSASIGTIHSFCQNTIKEYAISSNQVSSLDLADQDILLNFAKKYVREGNILKDIEKFLKINAFVEEEKLVFYFEKLTELYYLDKNFEEVDSIIAIDDEYYIGSTKLLAFNMYYSSDPIKILKNERPDYYEYYLTLKNANGEESNEFVEMFEDFKYFICANPNKGDFKIKEKNGYSSDEEEAYNSLFELKKDFNTFDREKYLAEVYIKDFYKSYLDFKKRNRLQSFNDMIRVIRELVIDDSSPLLECLKKKYSYAIIDEFQDTNQIQFDIFSKIFMCDDHNIIVVGDPKQSIYSFQGADVTVYEKAVELISKRGKKCRLGKNYRSAHAVVEFGNKLFPFYDFDCGFEPSDYCNKKDKNGEKRLVYKGNYVSSLWLNNEPLDAYSYARFAVEQIIDCTSYYDDKNTNLQLEYVIDGQEPVRKNVSFKDFAILSKTRTEMPFIKSMLNQAGIPYLLYKDKSLFAGVECADWIAILEAIIVDDFTGFNRGYFKKALFTKFFDLSLNEISKEKYDSDDIPEIELFKKWKNLSLNRLWQDLFDEIIIDSKLDNNMSSISDFQSLAVYKQIANYSIEYLSKGNGLFELVRHLRSISKFGNDEDEDEGSLIVAKSTDFDCVSLMTMHASKGLQFPVVISVAGLKMPWFGTHPIYPYHLKKDDGTYKRVVSLKKPNPDSAMDEAIDEYKRLSYVAYTRPEFLLIAPRYDEENNKVPKISSLMESFIEKYAGDTIDIDGEQVPYYELKDLKRLDNKTLRNATNTILNWGKVAVNEEQDLLNQKQVLLDLIHEKKEKVSYKHSYSSLAHPNREEDNEIIDDLLDIPKEGDNSIQNSVYDASSIQIDGSYDPSLSSLSIPDGYPKGASMGNAIHEAFEKVDFINYENNLENLIIDIFKSNGFNLSNKPEWIEYTEGIVKSVLNASLPIVKGNTKSNDEFKLNQIPFKDRKSEIEFNFNYPNEALRNYLNGFIDLVFKRGDVYSILDWKSDTLNDNFTSYSDKDKLKAQVDERYSIQRVLYSYCLIKWLKQYYKKGEDEIFNNHFGGIYYVFVRGCNEDTTNGVYVQTWNSWSDLESEFLNILKSYKEE